MCECLTYDDGSRHVCVVCADGIAALETQLADAKGEVERLKGECALYDKCKVELACIQREHDKEVLAMQALCDAAVAFSYGAGAGRTKRLLQAVDDYRAAIRKLRTDP